MPVRLAHVGDGKKQRVPRECPFARIGGGENQAAPGAPRRDRAGDRSSHGLDGAVEGKLPEHLGRGERLDRKLSRRGQDPERDGEVEPAAFLRQLGRPEIDDDAAVRVAEVRCKEGGPDPVLALPHGRGRKTDQGGSRQPSAQVDFDVDGKRVEPEQRPRANECERHGTRGRSGLGRPWPRRLAFFGGLDGLETLFERLDAGLRFSEQLEVEIELLAGDEVHARERRAHHFAEVAAQVLAEALHRRRVLNAPNRILNQSGRFHRSSPPTNEHDLSPRSPSRQGKDARIRVRDRSAGGRRFSPIASALAARSRKIPGRQCGDGGEVVRAPDRYAVTGHPIGHSKSPLIHRWFAAETGQGLRYDALASPLDGFRDVALGFRSEGGLGMNVTLPFKEEACELCDVRTPRAESAGAVNTLSFAPDGAVHGDNTDGVGLVRDLRDNRGVAIAGRRVLLIGAGGAARGVLPALFDERPGRVVVVNRTPERARDLAARFPRAPVEACGFGELDPEPFDIVINGTSAGLSGGKAPPVPISALRPGGACYDMVYAPEPTPFLLWSRAAGAAVAVDGAGMLVEQGAESFRRWRGVRPPTRRVIAALREALARE